MVALVLLFALPLGGCGGGTSVADLEQGDCFDDPPTAVIDSLQLTDCDQPHDNEVFANLLLEQSVFPGESIIAEFAADACFAPFEAYVGMPYAESDLDYSFLAPTADAWNSSADRTVTCFLYSADLSKLSGSAKG
jgi:hypothetical protein